MKCPKCGGALEYRVAMFGEQVTPITSEGRLDYDHISFDQEDENGDSYVACSKCNWRNDSFEIDGENIYIGEQNV